MRFSHLLTSFNACIGASIFEEIFYRGVTSSVSNESNFTFLIFGFTCSCLFVYSHYLSDQKRTKYSYMVLTVFSLVQFILYSLSGSIITCIIVHLIFNTPALIIDTRRYLFTRRESYEVF
ncbi:type II CAAX prenyl endopeptidase Rce1 family protein (plasmid) [Bacillus thuringiensis]